MKPLWKHDCSHCVFVYTVGNMDAYVCVSNQSLERSSVILRRSSRPEDYCSTGIGSMRDQLLKATSISRLIVKDEDGIETHVDPNFSWGLKHLATFEHAGLYWAVWAEFINRNPRVLQQEGVPKWMIPDHQDLNIQRVQ